MKCHYVYDEIAGKVLIPGCMAVAVSGRIEDCTCGHGTITESLFERKEIMELKAAIKGLQADNEYLISELHRYVDMLNRFRSVQPKTRKATLPYKVINIEQKYKK